MTSSKNEMTLFLHRRDGTFFKGRTKTVGAFGTFALPKSVPSAPPRSSGETSGLQRTKQMIFSIKMNEEEQ
ncbi:MAG: hypothetical protein C5B49_00605 [Bdellovibrio sp.]|nr:MAG: hypothetical protein C5B49_00605 [Bdellovibrio sp.]